MFGPDNNRYAAELAATATQAELPTVQLGDLCDVLRF
jgi:hypothetical protein